MRRAVRSTIAALAIAGLVACGRDDSALRATEANLADLTAAKIDLRLSSRAGTGDSATRPVGFRVRGPFAFSDAHRLALADLTYTRLRGAEQTVTRVRSTGDAAFVTVGAKTYRLPAADENQLRVEKGGASGVTDLGIAGWVRNEKIEQNGSNDVISGDVDVADMFSDLARIAESVGGESGLAALDGDAGERLQKLVRKSSIRIVTTHNDRFLHSLRATVDFGTKAPTQLRRTLGAYADAQIEIALTVVKSPKNLRVEVPANATKL